MSEHKEKTSKTTVWYVILTIVIALSLFALQIFIANVLWNAIIVDIFNAPKLTFLQTFGVQIVLFAFTPSSWDAFLTSKNKER